MMRLVMITTAKTGSAWSYDCECEDSYRWEDSIKGTKVEPDGEKWDYATVESAREDYGVIVPARKGADR